MRLAFGPRLTMVLVILGGFVVVYGQDCFKAIKKNRLCKYHIGDMGPAPNGTYVIKQNHTDPITEKSTLAYLNLDKDFLIVMDEFRSLFAQNRDRSTRAKCFKNAFLNREGVHTLLFANNAYLSLAKLYIGDFKEAYKSQLKQASQIEYIWESWGSAHLRNLTQYCLQNDYTSNLYKFYDESIFSCLEPEDDTYKEVNLIDSQASY